MNPSDGNADRTLKLMSPYLPEGGIPQNAKTHGNLRFWEAKEGPQTVKYAVGVLDHPDQTKQPRDLKAQRGLSKGTGYDAGHLIGHQFGGPEILENLSLQNPTMNQGAGNWYKLENQWADDLRDQKRVAVVIKEVSRPDTPNFLHRTVNSLTIDQDGRVKHDELSTLNPETERARASREQEPKPEPVGSAVILDLNAALARQAQVEREAMHTAEQRLAKHKPAIADPESYRANPSYSRITAKFQDWRDNRKENQITSGGNRDSETEVFGTLGDPNASGKAQAQPILTAQAAAAAQLQQLRQKLAIPQLNKMTVTADAKTGELTYALAGKTALIDKGTTITVLKNEPATTRIALEMAVQKYGTSVDATGTKMFQQQLVEAAVKMQGDISFKDPKLQARFMEAKAKLQQEENKALSPSTAQALSRQTEPKETGKSHPSKSQAGPGEGVQPRDPERAFLKYAQALEHQYGPGLDTQKADGLVALKMARTGWQPEEISDALKKWKRNPDVSMPQEVNDYAKKLTVQAVGRAAREAALSRPNQASLER